VVICLERGADLHMAQLMPLPLTVSCFSKIQIDFTFLVPADPGPGSPGKWQLNGCVCVVRVNNEDGGGRGTREAGNHRTLASPLLHHDL